MIALTWFFVFASALLFGDVLSAPAGESTTDVGIRSAATVPAAPRFVLYTDAWISGENGPPDPSAITVSPDIPYSWTRASTTVIVYRRVGTSCKTTIIGLVQGNELIGPRSHRILSFLLSSGPADQALEWTLISSSARASYLSEYAAAGISLIVSAYGSTEEPTTSGYDPVEQANYMGAWVKEYGLAGLDVDYEVRANRRCHFLSSRSRELRKLLHNHRTLPLWITRMTLVWPRRGLPRLPAKFVPSSRRASSS